ncbi:unnamed protein product [Pedinophyceae sp. YPF-701]|nr:unnamed protein product [Pedinophyceae sp. YPF-701]
MSAWRAAGNARDRANEFQQLAKRLEQTSQGQASAQNEAAAPLLPPMPKGNPAERSEFARRATRIGMGIHQVAGKLQKLSQLARRTSMFDDPTEEINELTVVVKQDIQTLNGAIGDLQSLATSLKEGHSNKQSQDHSSTVVDSLRTRLKDATMQFKDVLTQRTHSLKDQEGRRQIFSTHKAQGAGGERALPKLTVPGAPGAGGVPSFLQGAVPDVEQGMRWTTTSSKASMLATLSTR